jgi:hypothetical protein
MCGGTVWGELCADQSIFNAHQLRVCAARCMVTTDLPACPVTSSAADVGTLQRLLLLFSWGFGIGGAVSAAV